MARRIEYEVGFRFPGTKLTFLGESERLKTSQRHRRICCMCDCGKEKVFTLGNITQGKTTSCGCFLIEVLTKWKHAKDNPRLHFNWIDMIRRCKDPKDPSYHRYGGGEGHPGPIKVWAEWASFDKFYEYVRDNLGTKPTSQHFSLDRIDNHGHYEPGNLRWATDATQNQNRSNSVCTPELARKIRQGLVSKEEYMKLYPKNTSGSNYYQIRTGKTWNEDNEDVAPTVARSNMTWDIAHALKDGSMTREEAMAASGCSHSAMKAILNGQRWTRCQDVSCLSCLNVIDAKQKRLSALPKVSTPRQVSGDRGYSARQKRYEISIGTVGGFWTVTGEGKTPKQVMCECECGTIRSVEKYAFKKGISKSCGCKRPGRTVGS